MKKLIILVICQCVFLGCTNFNRNGHFSCDYLLSLKNSAIGNATIAVTTRYFLTTESDGVLIPTEELFSYPYEHTVEYYDKYHNLIIKETYVNASDSIPWLNFITYTLPEDGIKNNEVEYRHFIYDKDSYFIKVPIREWDEHGRPIIDGGTFKYDDDGYVVYFKTGNTIRTYSRLPNVGDKVIYSYKEISNDDEYFADGIKGLVQKGTMVYHDSDKIVEDIFTRYMLGMVWSQGSIVTVKDESGRKISEITKELSRNEGGLPILSMGEVGSKEYEEFFKERYFKNPSPNIKNYGNKKWEYDESGNLIRYRSFMGDEVDFLETAAEPKEAISKETDFKDHLKEYFNSLDLPLKRRSTVEHILEKEYIYNPEGEWTQCIIRGEKSLGTILATREISHIED